MKKICLLSVGLCSLLLGGCARYYYQPNTVNAPLLSDKNQLHIAGTIGGGEETYDNRSGNRLLMDIQGAFSPVRHLGIMANYSTWNYWADRIDVPAGHVDAHASLGEIGVGTYFTRGNKDRAQFVGEIYAGFGKGNLESDVDLKVNKFFIQPGLGLRHKVIDAAFHLRYSMINYYDLNSNGRNMQYLIDHNLFDPYRNEGIEDGLKVFIEPSFTLRTGYKFLRFQMNWTLSAPISHVPWNHNGSRFSFGIYFSLEEALDLSRKQK
jgi:hypothetical protein